MENPRYNQKRLSFRNFDMGFELGSVAIMDISPDTKSEQHSVAGKHLTRHVKNYHTAVDSRAKCLVGLATAAAVADMPLRIIKTTLETKGFLSNVNNCKKCEEMHKKLKNGQKTNKKDLKCKRSFKNQKLSVETMIQRRRMGITKPRTSASCGHLRTVVQTLQIRGLET